MQNSDFGGFFNHDYGHIPGWNLMQFLTLYRVWSLPRLCKTPLYLADFWRSNYLRLGKQIFVHIFVFFILNSMPIDKIAKIANPLYFFHPVYPIRRLNIYKYYIHILHLNLFTIFSFLRVLCLKKALKYYIFPKFWNQNLWMLSRNSFRNELHTAYFDTQTLICEICIVFVGVTKCCERG